MKRGFLCVVSTFLPMLLGVIAHAQELPDRYTKLRNAEAYILDEIRKGVEEERKKLPPKIDEFKSTSDLPQPWMYEPTLERRAREQQWAPTLQAEERAKKAKAGEYLPAEIKTRFYQQLAHDYRLREEAQAKFDWLRSINENLQGKFARLSAANPAERTMLEKEIANDVRRAERLACFILSCEWPAPAQSPASQRPQPSQTSAAPTGPPEPKLPQIPSERGALPSRPSADAGLLQEQEMIEARMKATAAELDPNAVISAAKEQFGTGRAAGGGVSLHRPARIEGLDPASVQRAVVENKTWSLILKDGRRIQMPDVQLDDLAVAIRSIYGPESQVTGKVVAADGPAVVVETGASRFGEMLWRISDLPKPPGATEKGKELSLPIRPRSASWSCRNRACSGSPITARSRIRHSGARCGGPTR